MATMQIIRTGSPILHMPAAPVVPALFNTAALLRLVEDVKETMRAGGVGLAAPQVNVPLRIIVLEDTIEYIQRKPREENERRVRTPFPFRAILNPVLRAIGDTMVVDQEGCLSVPGLIGRVKRHFSVEVTGTAPDGKPIEPWRAEGWPARILQHEIDHLDGILYLEKAEPGSVRPAVEPGPRVLRTGDDLEAWRNDVALISSP
jgi:peptide deformylase